MKQWCLGMALMLGLITQLPQRHTDPLSSWPLMSELSWPLGAPSNHSIPKPSSTALWHSTALVALQRDELLAAWFAGSAEGAGDVVIEAAHYRDGRWEAPFTLVDRAYFARHGWFISKLGNPSLSRDVSGQLRLWVVGVSVGGWAGSRIYQLALDAQFKPVGAPQMLITSGFFNLSSLVRLPVAVGANGYWVPSYHELVHKFSELLLLDANAQVIAIERLPLTGALQPAVLNWKQHPPLVLMRDGSDGPSGGDGLHGALWWSGTGTSGALPELVRADTSLAAWPVSEGRAVVVFNPSPALLSTATSDTAQHLQKLSRQALAWGLIDQHQRLISWHLLENSAGQEFSYPSLAVTNEALHLIYRQGRQGIRHWRFPRCVEAAPCL